jgi:SSS family solute:Na+ symporter
MLAGLVLGTALVARDGFIAVTVLSFGDLDLALYSAVVALAANLLLVAVLTPALDALGVSRGVDATGVSVPCAARSAPASRREWEGGRW